MSRVLNRFVKGFCSNLKTIIQALIFSVVIWLFISIQIFPDISMHISGIPVKYEPTAFMTEENLKITSIDTSDVTIQIQGKRFSISTLTNEDFIAECDLSGVYESGDRVVPITISPTKDNTDCKIVTNSLTAKITVIKTISKEIPVTANTENLNIAENMQIEGDVTVDPYTVTITGEEKLVESISHAEAVAQYDGILDRSEAISTGLTFYNISGAKMTAPDIRCDNNEFTVYVPVYKLKTLPVQVKFTGSSGTSGFNPDDLKYQMSINEITIASPDSSVDNLAAIDIGEISLSSLTLKDIQGGVDLPVELPEGYKNISGNRTITVTFPDADEFGQLGFTVPSENFTIINAPKNYDVKLLTNELVVNVVGYSNYVQTMTSSDIYATINLLGMEIAEGTKSVSITFRLTGANGKAWVTGEEYKVDLKITAAETS